MLELRVSDFNKNIISYIKEQRTHSVSKIKGSSSDKNKKLFQNIGSQAIYCPILRNIKKVCF